MTTTGDYWVTGDTPRPRIGSSVAPRRTRRTGSGSPTSPTYLTLAGFLYLAIEQDARPVRTLLGRRKG